MNNSAGIRGRRRTEAIARGGNIYEKTTWARHGTSSGVVAGEVVRVMM